MKFSESPTHMNEMKQDIDELRAVFELLQFLHKETDAQWPRIKDELESKINLFIDDEGEINAKAELTAYYFGMELQAMHNLLPNDLAARIYERMNSEFSTAVNFLDFWDRVKEYYVKIKSSIDRLELPLLDANHLLYSNILLHCISEEEKLKHPKEGETVNPLILMEFSMILMFPKHFWKSLLEKYIVVTY